MPQDRLAVALVSEVFPEPAQWQRELPAALAEAASRGANLVVLPELPLMAWSPASSRLHPDDAEPPAGPRHQAMAAAARASRVALLGGAIVEDSGIRRNRALLFGRDGNLLIGYDKLHLPHEEGFWERAHYEPGERLPKPAWLDGFAVGLQLCSDLNRPELVHALAAEGALAILGPRATEASTWERWRLVLRAAAITASCYLLSVTRPRPEAGVPFGGPSFAAAPDGSVLLESSDRLAMVTLEREAVMKARRAYPGYLPIRAGIYAEGWEAAGRAMAIEAAAAEDADAPGPYSSTQPLKLLKE